MMQGDPVKSRPAVSIIVPIYNVSKYIRKCVDSLIRQSLNNIEIILVDDGSQDDSGVIADEYADIDTRIKVVHKDNGGLGPARNSGIAVATGEYIGFVDGDDWVSQDMFEKLYSAQQDLKADIVLGGHRTFKNGKVTGIFKHPLSGSILNDQVDIATMRKNLYGHHLGDSETKSFPVTVCSNNYSRIFIAENDLSFRNLLSEDTLFNLSAFSRSRCIVFTDNLGYCYRKDGQASITRTFSPNTLVRYNEFIDALYESACNETGADRDDCIMRVRYAAVEYSRLFAGMVTQSAISLFEKHSEMERLIASDLFIKHAANYPVEALQLYHRAFQLAALHRHLYIALLIVGLRQFVKRAL